MTTSTALAIILAVNVAASVACPLPADAIINRLWNSGQSWSHGHGTDQKTNR
jgi:hypothetical protein